MTDPRKRQYRSQVRRANADATRQRIARAARDLMMERGYAATTMTDVAEAAGVAIQTLYTSCPGGKPGLAKAVYDISLAGDARQVPQRDRAEVAAIIAEPDVLRKLALYAAMAVGIFERSLPVYRILRTAAAAAPSDAGLRDLLSEVERRRLLGSRGPAEHLESIGALAVGLAVDHAAEQIYAFTSFELYENLTGVCRWSPEKYEAWLVGLLSQVLLKS